MKIYKYVTVLLAMVAMSATLFSCDRENDITGNPFADHTQDIDGKKDYWIDFTLSTSGSLTATAQNRFIELRDSVIYGVKGIKIYEHAMYCTEDYARANFQAVAAVSNENSDIVQKIMIPTFCVDTIGGVCHNDFVVTMTLYRDTVHVGDDVEFRNALDSHSWNATTAFDGPGIIAANKK